MDDDGDQPVGGEIPDPSTRSWRHPSEIAAEAAAAAAAVPLIPEGARDQTSVLSGQGSSASILWPMTVVGGCIAVAALGVFGLYLSDSGRTTLQVASVTTTPPSTEVPLFGRTSVTAPQARSFADPSADPVANPFVNQSGQEPGNLESLESTDSPLSTTTTTVASTTSTTPSTTVTTLAPILESRPSLVGPAVHVSSSDSAERLASVVSAGGHLLTSFSAMDWHVNVSLWVDNHRVDAKVSHVDPMSDLAIITPLEPTENLQLPSFEIGSPLAAAGLDVYVGYASESEADPEDSAQEDPEGDKPELIRNAERAGKVYSLDQQVETAAGRVVYELIQTGIPQKNPAAGAPLRDQAGRVVGMVVGSTSTNVAALPIGRAIEIGDSLLAIGTGNAAWLGLEVVSSADGLVVVEVTEGGPVDGVLQVDDVIDRADGIALMEKDLLEHLARKKGAGESLQVRLIRDGQFTWRTLAIGTATANTRAEN